ncbi:hypothetical protein [Chitinophaga sp. XS-30]|uniref:hypothetical protein n=1 Tax=Chitinophaga sp. XS-30 TaxID=2604421 RepID=UPI0011DD34BB|nr:hypothetical protein [Chitinophaga sp. XS-30]QEH42970.1 hypothetical protein FW415_19690 [Chitinophaga sp. XS-30]
MKNLLYVALLTLIAFSACKKNESKEDDIPLDETIGTWQFTADGRTFSGKIVTAAFLNLIGARMTLYGIFENGTTDSTFNLSVAFPGSKIETGTYKTEETGTDFALMTLPEGTVIYAANFSSAPLPPLDGQVVNISIDTYDSTTNTVNGTFSGEAYTIDEGVVQITNGKFKAKVTQL